MYDINIRVIESIIYTVIVQYLRGIARDTLASEVSMMFTGWHALSHTCTCTTKELLHMHICRENVLC